MMARELSWSLAKAKAKKNRDYLPLGEVVFDGLVTQPMPIRLRYFRALGRRIGLCIRRMRRDSPHDRT